MVTIYQCVIADGYTYGAEKNEEGTPGFESYWTSLRLAEVGCDVCDSQSGYLKDGRQCPNCEGSGVTQGQAFTVFRYDNVPEDVAEEMLDDPGDGYEWTHQIAKIAEENGWGEGVQVLDWEPDRVTPTELVAQTMVVIEDDGEQHWGSPEIVDLCRVKCEPDGDPVEVDDRLLIDARVPMVDVIAKAELLERANVLLEQVLQVFNVKEVDPLQAFTLIEKVKHHLSGKYQQELFEEE